MSEGGSSCFSSFVDRDTLPIIVMGLPVMLLFGDGGPVHETLNDFDNASVQARCILCDSVGNQQIITRWSYYKEEMCRKTGTF